MNVLHKHFFYNLCNPNTSFLGENGEGGMDGEQDGSVQDPDGQHQPRHAEDGLEDGSLATRESAFLEEGGGNNAEVRYRYLRCLVCVFVPVTIEHLCCPAVYSECM